MLDAIDSPLRNAVRELAQVEWDAAAWLCALEQLVIGAWFGKAAMTEPKLDRIDDTRRAVVGGRGQALSYVLPVLQSSLAGMARVRDDLRALDAATRDAFLTAPKGRAARGRQTKDLLLISSKLHLHRAGFSPEEICELVITKSRDGSELKNCRRRLDRYRNQHRRLRTLYNQDAPNY